MVTPAQPTTTARHTKLEILGMLPIVGIVFDGINAATYLAEGDLANAGLFMIALIPIVGQINGGARAFANISDRMRQVTRRGPSRNSFVAGTLVLMASVLAVPIDQIEIGDWVTATDDHPFWVNNQQAWIDAEDLKPGDILLLATIAPR